MFCIKCGTKNNDDSAFCKECGTPIKSDRTISLSNTHHHKNNASKTDKIAQLLNKIKKLSKRQKIVGTIIIVVLVGGGVAYSIYQNAQNAKQAAIYEEANNSSQTTTSEKPVLTAAEKLQTYAAAMEKYKIMSVDTFEALSRDERLLYSQYLIDLAIANGRLDSTYGKGGKAEGYAITPKPASHDSKGSDILDNYLYMYMVSIYQYTYNDGKIGYDKDTGEKILSSGFYAIGKEDQSYLYDIYKNWEEANTVPHYITYNYVATNTSGLLSGEDVNGNAIQYKIITYYSTDVKTSTYYARYIYHEFINYDGTHKSIWLLDDESAVASKIK